MRDIISLFSRIASPSGFEDFLRHAIIDTIAPNIGETDFMGNLIIKHPGTGPKILVEVQMDEESIVINHIDKDGFVRFYPASTLKESEVINRQVIFPSGALGFIGVEEIEEGSKCSFDKMFIDIGARDKKIASKFVSIGDHASFSTPVRVEEDRIVGGNLKIPVAVLSWVVKNIDTSNNLVFAFTTQGKLGGRGAAAVVTREQPDLIVTLDTFPATDTPNNPNKALVEIENGPVVIVRGMLINRDPYATSILDELAESSNIPIQRAVKEPFDYHDFRMASALGSIPIVTLAIPIRKFGIYGQVASFIDATNAGKLLVKTLRKKLTK